MIEDQSTSGLQAVPDIASGLAAFSNFDLCSPTAKMDLLRAQLAGRGLSPEGISWRLLILEWKYDLLVLSIHLGNWMKNVDPRFNRATDEDATLRHMP